MSGWPGTAVVALSSDAPPPPAFPRAVPIAATRGVVVRGYLPGMSRWRRAGREGPLNRRRPGRL
eukprot:7971148-Lingulodinium_polyedra.AAC.1